MEEQGKESNNIEKDNASENTKEERPHYEFKNEREKRLFNLQLKVNKARNTNKLLTVEEDKRGKEPVNADSKRARLNWEAEQEKEKQELVARGIDPEKYKSLNLSAVEAEWREKKKTKKEKSQINAFGWSQFNSEAQYNAYKKRLTDTDFSKEEYEQKKADSGDNFFPDANNLIYGQNTDISKERQDKMVEELQKTIGKRNSFSRRRAHVEGAYVDYINDRNRIFNKKIARAFDPYTAEIKQNLERGTAI